MKKHIPLILLVFTYTSFSFSQNIDIKISNYNKKIDSVFYTETFLVNSSYSSSRPFLFIVTNKKTSSIIENKVKSVFKFKQEYTDIYIIGIDSFNLKELKEIDKKIINNSIDQVVKFRDFFELPNLDKEEVFNTIIYAFKEDDICKYLMCKK